MKKISIVCVCLTLVFSTVGLTIAMENNTLYVDDDGTAEFITIQDAVDAAVDGDIIYVYPGTYYGSINITKSITLSGEDKTSTIIDGQQLGEDTITVTAPDVHISGFTIQNGPRGCGYNSGLKMENADNGVIEDIVFTDNCWAAEIRTSSNCLFRQNMVVDNEQGGLHLVVADAAVVSDCTFSGNYRSGISMSKGNDQVISSNTFIDCGISMGAQPPPGNTMHCTIIDNTVNGKPLVYLEQEQGKIIKDAGQVILNQCQGIIVRNLDLSYTDKGISVYKSSFVFILGNTISHNFHGVGIGNSFFVVLRNNKITDNWYNGLGLSNNIFTKFSFNEISGNNIGVYVHQSPVVVPYLNRVDDNDDCNYFVTPFFFPWDFQIG